MRRPPPLEISQEEQASPLERVQFNTFPIIDDDGHEYTVKLQDFTVLEELGSGSGGAVFKVLHNPSQKIMAKKKISRMDSETVNQVVKELNAMHKTSHPHVVQFYGAFQAEGSVEIILEFMNAGTLHDLVTLRRIREFVIPEPIIAHIAKQVLEGLSYLHNELHIIHRDIKPSNILLNTSGIAKVADFGVSSQLMNTMASAGSWVGTVTYMSPERIQGSKHYHIDTDIWSLGITLIELAIGRFPYPVAESDPKPMEFFQFLSLIVDGPTPFLDKEKYSPEFCNFVATMVKKDPRKRAQASQLLLHPFILQKADQADLKDWISEVYS
eukprot:GCRY01004149.1.p1 GENE.GCRY01004149.1~~GCRY01004149.1.p1  ORF type:complete len:326 (+),score=40.89 GCRY01004149.1:110-1087(+)